MVKHSIEPDQAHEKPVTLAGDEPVAFGDAAAEAPPVEEPALEEPEISAPATGDGNCFASDYWAHEADKAHAGTETGAAGAATTLGLRAYAENVRVGTESQVATDLEEKGGEGVHAVVAQIGADVDDNFREAQRNLTASREAGAGAGAPGSNAPSISSEKGSETPSASRSRPGIEPGDQARGESQSAQRDGPSATPRPLPTAALAKESFGVRDINRLLAEFKGQKFDCMDCGGEAQVAAPANSPGQKTPGARVETGFDTAFFAKKSSQNS